MLRALRRPEVLIRVPPLCHRGLSTAWPRILAERAACSHLVIHIMLVLLRLVRLLVPRLVLLERLGASRELVLLEHLVRAPKEQLARVLRL